MFFKYIKLTAQKGGTRVHLRKFRLDPSCSFAALIVHATEFCTLCCGILIFLTFIGGPFKIIDLNIKKKQENENLSKLLFFC